MSEHEKYSGVEQIVLVIVNCFFRHRRYRRHHRRRRCVMHFHVLLK
jgi:hypothetical protein